MAKKILIVDDDAKMSDLISEFCLDSGHDVKSLNDSRHVLETVLSWKPDLITLDLEMPHKDGLDVLKELRSHPQTQGIPVMIISCLIPHAAIPQEDVQGVFSKPINFTALLKQISQISVPA